MPQQHGSTTSQIDNRNSCPLSKDSFCSTSQGAYNTTPTAVLHVIEGLMPLHIKAKMQSTLAARYWSIDDITKRADPICMQLQFEILPDAATMPPSKHPSSGSTLQTKKSTSVATFHTCSSNRQGVVEALSSQVCCGFNTRDIASTEQSSNAKAELSLECSDDENEFESMRIATQEEEEEGHEVSETECDRELKTLSKIRGTSPYIWEKLSEETGHHLPSSWGKSKKSSNSQADRREQFFAEAHIAQQYFK
ncbi:hypothetical protein AVEN_265693-1 [Araneus ventricosus]|uniref:Uncharacterized protein n=1 Tax=Araneus ventricosus TaxID=182803 RepID=A0A4Y2N537_ARAVE|nr:hypothetical protein AVEN_265693-1 [Araneus ventricosus]